MNLNGKHVLILGLGESGLACAQWCVRQGARVRVADTRSEPPKLDELRTRVASAEFVGGEFSKALLEGIDLLVLSPGLSGGLMVALQARGIRIPVVGEIELFAQGLRKIAATGEAPAPVVAITGTNGKTTTTALAGHLLRATGKSVGVAGNISPAALTALMDAQDADTLPQLWVIELSSFQLETTATLNPAAATVLNISEDHLDRYINLEEYASAKARVFKSAEGAPCVQVLNRDDPRVRRMALAGHRIISFGLDAPATEDDFGLRENRGEAWLVQGERFLLPLSELPLAGLHNAANAMAALALCASLGFDAVALLPALRSFRGLPHRVEKIAEINGVIWYNDSKGTNVGATVAALDGIGGQLGAQNNHITSSGSEGAPILPNGNKNDRTSHLPPSGREAGREGTPILPNGNKNDRTSHLPPSGREAGREGTPILPNGNKNDRKIILIAGGEGKGQDFSPLKSVVTRHARAVILLGRDAPLIESAIHDTGVAIEHVASMEDAVAVSKRLACPGDAVLLSPACASFDMFRNYPHRGQVFAAAVHALESSA